MLEVLFPADAMAPVVRVRLSLLRERVNSEAGLEVTCGGASMEPVIARGARVRVVPGKARVGRVAAFLTEHGAVELHRLVAPGPGGWWTHLGDNQADPTPGLVHASHILGMADVPARRPSARQIVRAMTRIAGAAVTVARRSLQPR